MSKKNETKTKKTFKKKKTPAAYQLSKFIGGRKVKVFKKFFHFGLCELRRQRIKNWHKEFKRGDLTITMQAPESINMYDKGILLAILVLFAEKADKLKTGEIINNPKKIDEKKKELIIRKGKADERREILRLIDNNPTYQTYEGCFDVFKFVSVSVDFGKFCRDYAGVSRAGQQNVLDSIKRWLFTKTSYEQRTGKKTKEFYTFHYIVDFTLDKQNIATFILSQQLLDSCSNGLILAYDTFMSIKTEIGKMLYLFFLGNTNTVFSYTSLKDALGLTDEDKFNHRLIMQGLDALKEKEILSGFAVENRVNDSYYAVTYGRFLKDNQEKQPFIDNNIINMADCKALPDSVNDGHQSVNDGHQSVNDGHQSVNDGHQSVNDGHQCIEIV